MYIRVQDIMAYRLLRYLVLLVLLLGVAGFLYFQSGGSLSSFEEAASKLVYGELYQTRFALDEYLALPETKKQKPLAFVLSLGSAVTEQESYKKAASTFDDRLLQTVIGPLLQEPLAEETVAVFDVFPFIDAAVIELYPEEVDFGAVLSTIWSLYRKGVIDLWDAPAGTVPERRLLSYVRLTPLAAGEQQEYARGKVWERSALARALWVDAPAAWSLLKQSKRPSSETIVAMLDTGVRYDHNALRDSLYSSETENPLNALDDDENGCVNDIHGCRFSYLPSSKGVPFKEWWRNRNFHGIKYSADGEIIPPKSADRKGHGTRVAGVVSASWNSEKAVGGVVGPADVKLLTLARDGSSNAALFSSLMASLQYLIRFNQGAKKVKVVNFSAMIIPDEVIPDSSYSPLCRAMERMQEVLFVVGAGNRRQHADAVDASPTYPISCRGSTGKKLPNQIVVASFRETKSPFSLKLWGHGHTVDSVWTHQGSGYGFNSVDLAAPNEIWSTGVRSDSQFRKFKGTSAAAPVVSGIAGMLLSLKPELSAIELKQLLLDTVLPSTTKSFREGLKSMGRVNACNAVANVLSEELGIAQEEASCACCKRHADGKGDSCFDPETSTADYHDYFLREPCSCIVAGISNKACCELFFEKFTAEKSTDLPGFAEWFKSQDFYRPELDCS